MLGAPSCRRTVGGDDAPRECLVPRFDGLRFDRLLRRPRRGAIGFDVVGVPRKITLMQVLDV